MNTEISPPPLSSPKPGMGYINPRGVAHVTGIKGGTPSAEEASSKPEPKILYLRDRGNRPVGAIAFQVEGEVIRFGFALKHPSDAPNKQIARNVALGHMAKQTREIPFVKATDKKTAGIQVLVFLSKSRGEYKKGGIPVRLPVAATNTLQMLGVDTFIL